MIKKLSHLNKILFQRSSNSFLNPNNVLYLERRYQEWLDNPKSVPISFQVYFENMDLNEEFPHPSDLEGLNFMPTSLINFDEQVLYNQVVKMIKQFEDYGHYYSDVDPTNHNIGKTQKQQRKFNFIEIEQTDIPKELYDINLSENIPYVDQQTKTPRQLHQKLLKLFCGQISFQFTHLTNNEQKQWIEQEIKKIHEPMSDSEKLQIFDYLTESSLFSQYQEIKFQALKRFGIEGLDASISGLMYMMDQTQNYNIKEIVLGMAHRGRLNTLSCVFKKPYRQAFGEFEQVQGRNSPQESIKNFMGDVKYHFGTNHLLKFENGEKVQISMLANPSHLEVVNPVVLGNVRARQVHLKDQSGQHVLPIIIHGDAAFAAQGVNYETQQMENLKNFYVGGAIHIVFNNQIGFTADEEQSRTSFWSTSIAQINRNFVIQVNAENPELVSKALNLAMKYRQKFKRDIFVDIIGYRKYGHNEQDLPDFTQPLLYQKIRQYKSVYEKYAQKLINEGLLTEGQKKQNEEKQMEIFKKEHELGKQGDYDMTEGDFYNDFNEIKNYDQKTGMNKDLFYSLGKKLNVIPEEFNAHERIQQLYQQRQKEFEKNTKISWYTAESLAFSTLLDEGFNVRLAGQDVAFGLFFNRNLVIENQKTSKSQNLIDFYQQNKSSRFTLANQTGSQFGALGFEYGYSYGALKDLTIWEVWLSEYLNNAQQMIDQFVMTSEKKWGRCSNLVINIPYNAYKTRSTNVNTYMNRILSNLSDDFRHYESHWDEVYDLERNENYLVYNITQPSNYFHALRGQVKNDYRKPLFIYQNEQTVLQSGSHHPLFWEDKKFIKVIDEKYIDKKNAKKVVFCSGKFYFDLRDNRTKYGRDDIALVRLEQLGPFPYAEVFEVLDNYSKDVEVVFAQGFPRNFGAFEYVEPRLNMVLRKKNMNKLKYVGKKVNSLTGSSYVQSQNQEFNEVFEKLFKNQQFVIKINLYIFSPQLIILLINDCQRQKTCLLNIDCCHFLILFCLKNIVSFFMSLLQKDSFQEYLKFLNFSSNFQLVQKHSQFHHLYYVNKFIPMDNIQ